MNNLGKKGKITLSVILFLVFCNIFVWKHVSDFIGNPYLNVIFFTVGQGDAIFIQTPQKHQILIDGGPDSAILGKMSKRMPFWDRSIDLIILTHPEADHLAGLIEILKYYKVDYILWTGVVRDTSEFKEWQKLIGKEGAEIIIAQANQKIRVGEILLNILSPLENMEGKKLADSNDTSIVSQLIFNNNSFLFTGDISGPMEERLADEKVNLDSDVLKVSHHGSKYSTFDKFLEAVTPKIAIIQVGKNNYGHPTEETINRLKKFISGILRTDKNGDIEIMSDGGNLKILNNI